MMLARNVAMSWEKVLRNVAMRRDLQEMLLREDGVVREVCYSDEYILRYTIMPTEWKVTKMLPKVTKMLPKVTKMLPKVT